MSKAWKRSDGKIIKGDDGKILVCDECPCGGCCSGSLPSSFFVTHNGPVTPIQSGTLNLISYGDLCSNTHINPVLFSESCLWGGILTGGGGNDERGFLYAWWDTGASAFPRWAFTWGLILNPDPSHPGHCSGFQNTIFQNPLFTSCEGASPVGLYTQGSPGFDDATIS